MSTFLRSPYSWRYRPFSNLKDALRTLFVRLPRNVWRYRAWLANDADFDWEYLADVMEMKLRAMSAHFAHQCVEDWESMVNETREAADILHRLREDEYADDHGYERYEESMTAAEKHAVWERASADRERDKQRFGELMTKLPHWWD